MAYEQGLIPYIPADRETSDTEMKRTNQLYELEVALLSGPITEAFAKKNPSVLRTIQICGDQTLEDLHEAIFNAFDREDEHMYEFQVGGKGPMDVCDIFSWRWVKSFVIMTYEPQSQEL